MFSLGRLGLWLARRPEYVDTPVDKNRKASATFSWPDVRGYHELPAAGC